MRTASSPVSWQHSTWGDSLQSGPAGGIKVLVCSRTFYPPEGGGVISLRAICAGLSKKGYDISTMYLGPDKDPAWRSHPLSLPLLMRGMWPRIWELDGRLEKAISQLIESEKPDVVITQQDVAIPTVAACRRHSIPSVILLQGVDIFCLGSFWAGTPWKCEYRCVGCKDNGGRLWQFPFFRNQIGRLKEAFANADAVVSNSEFTRKTLEMIWGVDSSIATPIPKGPKIAPSDKPGDRILFFSPVAHKGVDIAVSLAQQMKDEKFIFAGGAASRKTLRGIDQAGNIEYLQWTSDTDSLYRRTKLLIMPSLIPEGFGRGCAEAMRRGIPCIVSDIGALPETVGTGGDVIHDYHNAAEWVRVLAKYRDSGHLAQKSRSAVLESERFNQLKTIDQMDGLLRRLARRKQ